MTLPVEIETAVVSFGPYSTYRGGFFAPGGKVRFRASRAVVWTATGTPLLPGGPDDTVLLDEDAQGQVELPVVSQDGFSDGQGNEVKNWTYRAEIDLPGRTTEYRSFQILSTDPIDLDLTTPVDVSPGDIGQPIYVPAVQEAAASAATATAAALAAGIDSMSASSSAAAAAGSASAASVSAGAASASASGSAASAATASAALAAIPSWWFGTQVAYDAIPVKSPTTMYFING